MHPDEIMQYLEQAHRLVFGNGIVYWEFFYGARSWLLPSVITVMLKLFDMVGLGEPFWYVDGIKLIFCAISLTIPAGMYFFARHHFSELAARVALIAGVFWYELVGFGHKPMTEFIATGLLLGLLFLCTKPSIDRVSTIWKAVALAVLATAFRVQYAPVALILLGFVFLQTPRKFHLIIATAVLVLAIGLFDALTWDGGLFHSYWTNVKFNLVVGGLRAGESPVWQYFWWFVAASTGLAVSCLIASIRWLHRYSLLFLLIVLVLVLHSLQGHKEYRFVFVIIPLWLMIFSDLGARLYQWVMRLKTSKGRPCSNPWAVGTVGTLATLFAGISLAGILNALPGQSKVYKAWSHETEYVGAFLRNQDPLFEAYRYLSEAPDVRGVLQHDRPYFVSPGYYYLHHSIPYYGSYVGKLLLKSVASIQASVSHVVTSEPDLQIPGYSLDRSFGEVRILRRDSNEDPIRLWKEYAPIVISSTDYRIMREVRADLKLPPPNHNIRFVEAKP